MVPLHKGVEHIENPGECPLHEVVKTQMNNRNNQREGLAQKMDNLKISDADKQEKQPKEHIVEPLLPNANASATIENGINKVIELPTHLKLHQEYLKYVPNIKMVQCVACKIEISNDLFTLRNHVTHPSHLKQINQENYGKKINYYCEICPQTLNNEKQWILHLDAPNHKQKTKRLGNSRQDNLKENICLACNTIIFGDAISAMRHKLDGVSQLRKDKVGQLTVGIKELLNSRRKIEEKSKALGKECQKFEEQTKPLIQKCISDLEQILKDVYPDCKIYQFGSRVVGVINEESDLDLFIDIGGRYAASDESGDSRVQQKLVSATCKLLRTHSKVFKDLLSIPSARVPIIKALHCSTEIDCDLSFANGLSVENTRLIKFYVNYEPAFYGALLILKEWGQQMKPKLKNDLTSYALCIMLIFKMQVDGYLPSVHQVREMSTFDVVNIAGWDTIDYTKLDSEQLRTFTHKAESVSEVVLSFFRYYGDNFNYSTDVACPLLGKTFKVKDFDAKGEKLPAEMHTYKRKIAVDPDAQFRCLCHMFVQDPFDLGHNLTKNINKSFVNSFKKVCRMSYEHVRK